MAVPPQTLRRDERLTSRQSQIGACLAAIGATVTSLLKSEGGDMKQIEALCDTGRLLADVHYAETSSRRELLAINLNKSLRETLNEGSVDSWLFGENLEARMKVSKELEKSGAILKADKTKIALRRPQPSTSANFLNPKGPLRNWGNQSGRQTRPIPNHRPHQKKYQTGTITHQHPRSHQKNQKRPHHPREMTY